MLQAITARGFVSSTSLDIYPSISVLNMLTKYRKHHAVPLRIDDSGVIQESSNIFNTVRAVGAMAMSLAPTETIRMSSGRILSLMNASWLNKYVFRSRSRDASTAALITVASGPRRRFSQKAISALSRWQSSVVLYIAGVGTPIAVAAEGSQYLLSSDESPAKYTIGFPGLSAVVIAWNFARSDTRCPLYSE